MTPPQVSPVLSVWVQLGSMFFVFSGISADLLLIRFFLFMGYVFLFLNAVLGGPLWPSSSNPGYVAVDSLIWACLGLYIHGTSAIALYMDELPIQLSENEEALWRLFYRSGGLSKKLFKTIVADKLQVDEFGPGDCIPSDDYFNILYKGLATIEIVDAETGRKLNDRQVFSGEMFDCSDLQQFADGGFFSKNRVKATARSNCTVFRISIQNMKKIANQRFAKGVIQTMLIDAMESIIEAYHNGGEKPIPTRVRQMEVELGNGLEDNNFKAEYIAPSFQPLEVWEQPQPLSAGSGESWKHPVQHFTKYFLSFLGPPPPFGGHPTGIRHTLLAAPSRLSHKEKAQRTKDH